LDSNELMLMKKEVISTTHSRGWYYIKKMAEDTVARMERTAIDEEDDIKGSALRRQAKAARQFLADFLQQIEITSRVEVPESPQATDAKPADDFYEVADS